MADEIPTQPSYPPIDPQRDPRNDPWHDPRRLAPPPPPPPPKQRSLFVTILGVTFTLILLGIIFVAGGALGLAVGAVAGAAGVASVAAGGLIAPGIYQHGEGSDKIAILPIEGIIDGASVVFVHNAVESILRDRHIRAVILRVESPGGGATASDEILRELSRLKKERNLPVIASYGDYAASGGYYVSCQADIIIAQPTCITGSIGVIAPFFTVERLMDKVGVTPQVVTSTAAVNKDVGSMFRAWTEKDHEMMRHLLDGVQEQFISVVAEGRKGKLTPEETRDVATGLPLMAKDALAAKLIDRIGYLDHAITEARDRGGITEHNPPVVVYRARPTLLTELGLSERASGGAGQALSLPVDAAALRRAAAELMVPQRWMLLQP